MSTLETTIPITSNQPPTRLWRVVDLVVMTIASIVLILLLLVGSTVALIFGMGIDPTNPEAMQALVTSLPFTIATGISTFIALVGSVWAVSTWRKRSAGELGLLPINRRVVLLALAAAVSLRILALPLVYALQALGFPMDNPQISFLAPNGFDISALLAVLLIAGVLIPFAEELFFRGVLYPALRERWGSTVGILVSSLVFGAIHGHITIAAMMFFVGAACAIAYQRSGSLWASIVLHGFFNILGIGLLYAALASGMQLPGM